MNIPPKYEDVVAQLEAALSREAALREELSGANEQLRMKSLWIAKLIPERDDLQQRLTVAEQLLLETSDYLDGATRNAVWCDSILHKKMKAALNPAADVEALGTRPAGCCCPPKGHTGIWAAAMCPVHFGLKRPGVKP